MIATNRQIIKVIDIMIAPHAKKLNKLWNNRNNLTEEERKEYIASQTAVRIYNTMFKRFMDDVRKESKTFRSPV